MLMSPPGTTSSMVRHPYQPMNVKTVALYLAAAWLVAGSLLLV